MIPVAIRRTELRLKRSNRPFEDFKSRLRIGQILQGRVVRAFPERKVLVRFLGFNVVAESNVPLQRGERVTVAVRALDPVVHLGLAPMDRPYPDGRTDYPAVLRTLGLDIDALNLALVAQTMRYGGPVEKRTLKRLRKRITGLTAKDEEAPAEEEEAALAQAAVLLDVLGLPIDPGTVARIRSIRARPPADSIDYTV